MGKHIFLTTIGVASEIKSWRPRNCHTELEYRNSLLAKLQGAFPIAARKEYGHGRVKADIAFENRIGIELKFNLNSPAKKQRLVGQLNDYRGACKNIIGVLVGKTDPDLYQELSRSEQDVVLIKK